jgi:hypothetical protein
MTLIPDLERELVAAADRRRSLRGRTRRAAAVGVAVAAAAALALVTFGSTDEGSAPKRAAGEQRQSSPAPPRFPAPMRGSLVRLASFDFRGVHYRLSGYRSRGGYPSRGDVICAQIRQSPPVAPDKTRPSVTCSGEHSLRRGLRRDSVLNVGGGGGERLLVSGFARAEVAAVAVVGTGWRSRPVLTRPWRPWDGPRIRAFTIVVVPPRGVDVTPTDRLRIRAVEAVY